MVKKITGMIVLLCLIVAMFGFSAYADELKSIEGMKIELDEWFLSADGQPKTPLVTIEGLEEGVDFTVEFKNNVKAGEATVTVTGIGGYTGTLEANFFVMLEKPEITSITIDTASGEPVLTWTPVEGAYKYYVYRDVYHSGSFSFIGSTTDTKYIDNISKNHPLPKAGETCDYKVNAIMKGLDECNSELSDKATIVATLEQPTNLKPSIQTQSGKPMITWSPVDDATEYEIYRSTSKDGEYSFLCTTTDFVCGDSSAVAGTTYYYKVKAKYIPPKSNKDNRQMVTSVDSKSCYITCDLPYPTNVKVTTNEYSGKPYITWNAVNGADKYYIYRSNSKNGEYSYLGSTVNTHYTNTGAVAGNTYYYKVKATMVDNEYATSAKSDYGYVTCDLPQPKNVMVNNVSTTGKPRITWTAVEGADKYYVYRATSKNGEYSFWDSTVNTHYTNISAKPGTTYYYKVKAIDSNNSYANSAQSKYCYITCDLPKTTVTVTLSSGDPYLQWEPVEGASKYQVWKRTEKEGYWKEFTICTLTTETSLLDKSVPSGAIAHYKIVAVCPESEYGNSAFSNVVSIAVK